MTAHELDPVIHAQARLRVMTTLNALGEENQITFPGLKDLLGMTAGNLSVHLTKLEEALRGDHQDPPGAHPATYVALTRQGRRAFEDYTTAIRELLDLT
ncbi:transcriptional regulator [Streptosporangium lutulentum]